jgi:hypothetical protein
MSPSLLRGLEVCLRGQQDQEGSFPSWLKLIFFTGLDQHVIARLEQMNGKVKWGSLC